MNAKNGREERDRLKAENERLKAENKELRGMTDDLYDEAAKRAAENGCYPGDFDHVYADAFLAELQPEKRPDFTAEPWEAKLERRLEALEKRLDTYDGKPDADGVIKSIAGTPPAYAIVRLGEMEAGLEGHRSAHLDLKEWIDEAHRRLDACGESLASHGQAIGVLVRMAFRAVHTQGVTRLTQEEAKLLEQWNK